MSFNKVPAAYADLESAAEDAPVTGKMRQLDVPGVGVIVARKPAPRAADVLAKSVRSRMSNKGKIDHLMLFLQDHMDPDGVAQLLSRMVDGNAPPDAIAACAQAIATWGTSRPTGPSSRCAG